MPERDGGLRGRRTTREHADDERRVRFLFSTTSTLSAGRVRTVEITADLVQRRLGIATVRLASGEELTAWVYLYAADVSALPAISSGRWEG